MHFKRVFCLAAALVILLSSLAGSSFAQEGAPDPSVTSGSHSLDAAVPMIGYDKLIDNSKACILYEATTGTLMHAHNADARAYPASLVKIMTAYVAIMDGNLEDVATVRGAALNSLPKDSVSCRLKDGEQMKLKDLLLCMQVQSANDACVVIAEHISGSQTAFVKRMNEYAQQLGCTGTNFMNPHGIHHENQYTTARDMAKILAAAMELEAFREIFCAVSCTIPATNMTDERNYTTGNHLMNTVSMTYYYDSRITGGRTGVDYQGFRHIASTAEENNMLMISVILGSVSEFEPDGVTVKSFGGFLETSEIMNAGLNNYRKRQIVSADQVMRQITVSGGDCDLLLGVKDSVSTILPSNVTLENLSLRYTDIQSAKTAPVEKGNAISHLQVWYGPNCLVQTDVYALNDVPLAQDKVIRKEIKDQESPWWVIVLIAVGAVVIVFVVVLICIRSANMKKYRKRRNPYGKRR